MFVCHILLPLTFSAWNQHYINRLGLNLGTRQVTGMLLRPWVTSLTAELLMVPSWPQIRFKNYIMGILMPGI